MSFAGQACLLLVRNLREGLRNPILAYLIPLVVPPAVLVLVATTLSPVTLLPGFPTRSYADWIMPATVMMTALGSSGYAATSLVIDIQSGFIQRLRLLEVDPTALLLSRVLFDVVRVMPGGAVVVIVGLVLGTELNEGVAGIVLLFGLLALWAAAYGGLHFVVGLSTGNAQAPVALVPLAFPIMFMSPAFLPKSVLPSWVETASRGNPYTYVVEASRAVTAGPFSTSAVAGGFAAALGVLLITQIASMRAFSHAVDAG